MIKGFEDITYELTSEELVIADVIKERLLQNIGREMIVSNTRICKVLKAKGYKVTGPRVRKILNYLRTSDRIKMLIANQKGYYITTSIVEMNDYIDSLTDRIRAQEHLKAAMQQQLSEHQRAQQIELDFKSK